MNAGKSKKATRRVLELVIELKTDIDTEDQRTVPKWDRVPRSLQVGDLTQPGFWDITNPGETLNYNSE